MKERWLYCEGQTDAPVLKSVFAAFGFDVIAESTGGNPGEIVRWRRENNVVAASVSDRDYQSKVDCDASYSDGSVKFLWRRHSIENYLLEPVVVTAAINNIKRTLQAMPYPPACTDALPENDVEAIRNELHEAGKQLFFKESGCLCIHSLWVDLRESLGRIQQRVPAVFTSGNSVTEEDCVAALTAEAARLTTATSDAINSDALTEGGVARRYTEKLAEIQRPEYQQNMTFLHEFHGKRLLKAFLNRMNQSFGFQSSASLFTSELTIAIESIAVESPDADCLADFRELGESVLSL